MVTTLGTFQLIKGVAEPPKTQVKVENDISQPELPGKSDWVDILQEPGALHVQRIGREEVLRLGNQDQVKRSTCRLIMMIVQQGWKPIASS